MAGRRSRLLFATNVNAKVLYTVVVFVTVHVVDKFL